VFDQRLVEFVNFYLGISNRFSFSRAVPENDLIPEDHAIDVFAPLFQQFLVILDKARSVNAGFVTIKIDTEGAVTINETPIVKVPMKRKFLALAIVTGCDVTREIDIERFAILCVGKNGRASNFFNKAKNHLARYKVNIFGKRGAWLISENVKFEVKTDLAALEKRLSEKTVLPAPGQIGGGLSGIQARHLNS
jgi:hypothetical protein